MVLALALIPILGALLAVFTPDKTGKTPKVIALVVTLVNLGLAGSLLASFNTGISVFQNEVKFDCFPAELGITCHFGIDGISLWLVILTSLLSFVAVAFSFHVDTKPRLFMAMILLLEGAMIGSFVSLDLIFFFTFFELTLIPMWLMIYIWGGPRRVYAANKFLIYTFAGSIFLLVGIAALAFQASKAGVGFTFDIVKIQAGVAHGEMWTNAVVSQGLVFWAFAAAFLVKSPVFPFHTWVPDTYAESPTAGPILSGAMVKLGSYGFLRFCLPLFPEAAKNNVAILSAMAVVGILIAAIIAAVQTDMRRLLAYSSVSHMGFVLLGIFSLDATGMIGGAYQQLNHGVVSCMLFLLVGFLIQRRGTAQFADYGGLKAQMPIFAALFLIAMLGGIGLPGTNGFVGEFLTLAGTYNTGFQQLYGIGVGIAIAAAAAMVLAAAYMLTMFQRIFYGTVDNPTNRRLRDLLPWEIGLASILGFIVIAGGLQSSFFTKSMEPSVLAAQAMATKPVGERPMWDANLTPKPGGGMAMQPMGDGGGAQPAAPTPTEGTP